MEERKNSCLCITPEGETTKSMTDRLPKARLVSLGKKYLVDKGQAIRWGLFFVLWSEDRRRCTPPAGMTHAQNVMLFNCS